jgi:hypothetical protein
MVRVVYSAEILRDYRKELNDDVFKETEDRMRLKCRVVTSVRRKKQDHLTSTSAKIKLNAG